MADTWLTDITHFLDENGEIITKPSQAKVMAEYFAAIIMMVSFPEPEYPPEYKVSCRRRPNKKTCQKEIVGWIEPESEDIYWICPKCQDRGRLRNWRGTMWDLSDGQQISH